MNQKLLRVKNWGDCFESGKTESKTNQTQCLIPNKQDGSGYNELMARKDGENLYGAFCALILLMSKQSKREGWLTDTGKRSGAKYTPRYLADKTGFSESTMGEMLEFVVEIGWVGSSDNISKGVAYPSKRPSDELIALAKKFHDAQAKKYPYDNGFRDRETSDLNGAIILARFQKQDEYWTLYNLSRVLDFVVNHRFWAPRMTTLLTARKPGADGNMKLDNIRKQMQAEDEEELLTGEQVAREMHKHNLDQDEFERVKDPRSEGYLYRRVQR